MNLTQVNLMKIGFILLCLLIGGVAFYLYKSIFSYFILSLIFVYFANPVVTVFENLGIRRSFSILLFYLLLFSSIFFIIYFLLPLMLRQGSTITSAFNEFISLSPDNLNELPFVKNIEGVMQPLIKWFPFIELDKLTVNLQFIISQTVKKLPNYILLYSKDIASFFSYFVIVPVMSFFILRDVQFFKKEIFKLIPNRYFEISIILINQVNNSIITYLKTLLIEVSIVGGMTALVLTLIGVKFGILIGLIAGLFNIIPYLGPFSAALFASLSVLLTGRPISMVVYTILGMWAVQIIDNNIVFPMVMSKGIEIHPLYVFLTAIAGGLTFGFIGMLLALPLLYLVSGIIQVLYKNLKDFDII